MYDELLEKINITETLRVHTYMFILYILSTPLYEAHISLEVLS